MRKGSEDTKITDMRVAYTLHRYPGYRRGRQIVGHDEHCAAIERERAGAHTLVPQRNQFGHADGGLLLQKADRFSPALLHLPNGMGIQRRLARVDMPARDRSRGSVACFQLVTSTGGLADGVRWSSLMNHTLARLRRRIM